MSILFVPVVPPRAPSRQAGELAELLDDVIKDYARTHSSVTPREIRAALMLAEQRSAGSGVQRTTAAAAALVGALVAGVAVFARAGGLHFGGQLPLVEVLVLVLMVVAVLVALMRRRP